MSTIKNICYTDITNNDNNDDIHSVISSIASFDEYTEQNEYENMVIADDDNDYNYDKGYNLFDYTKERCDTVIEKYNDLTEKYNDLTEKYNNLINKYNESEEKYNIMDEKYGKVTYFIIEYLLVIFMCLFVGYIAILLYLWYISYL